MKVLIFIVFILQYICICLAYDKDITFQDFKDCQQEYVSEGNGSQSWADFKKIIAIDTLRNNYKHSDEILRTRFYYQGPRDLSVMLSDINRDYKVGDSYFHTILGANCNSSSAVIYIDRDWHACTL
uniref:Uncharacterized protein n=1 Tax=Megaselia scalaris TaxID=36166 RepID=T1H266_MEGSC